MNARACFEDMTALKMKKTLPTPGLCGGGSSSLNGLTAYCGMVLVAALDSSDSSTRFPIRGGPEATPIAHAFVMLPSPPHGLTTSRCGSVTQASAPSYAFRCLRSSGPCFQCTSTVHGAGRVHGAQNARKSAAFCLLGAPQDRWWHRRAHEDFKTTRALGHCRAVRASQRVGCQPLAAGPWREGR
jgi:hypothetical protein